MGGKACYSREAKNRLEIVWGPFVKTNPTLQMLQKKKLSLFIIITWRDKKTKLEKLKITSNLQSRKFHTNHRRNTRNEKTFISITHISIVLTLKICCFAFFKSFTQNKPRYRWKHVNALIDMILFFWKTFTIWPTFSSAIDKNDKDFYLSGENEVKH